MDTPFVGIVRIGLVSVGVAVVPALGEVGRLVPLVGTDGTVSLGFHCDSLGEGLSLCEGETGSENRGYGQIPERLDVELHLAAELVVVGVAGASLVDGRYDVASILYVSVSPVSPERTIYRSQDVGDIHDVVVGRRYGLAH